jgi:hypothetical protein
MQRVTDERNVQIPNAFLIVNRIFHKLRYMALRQSGGRSEEEWSIRASF